MMAAVMTSLGAMASGARAQSIEPPPGSRLVLQVNGVGVQIYDCFEGGWTLNGPQADLFDSTGKKVGTHFKGPGWKLTDGSEVHARPSAMRPAPTADAVAWVLLAATEHLGAGTLITVDYITRTDTKGGAAPSSGCGAANQGAEVRVKYSGVYRFYSNK
jgi:hypothetical protein